MGINYYQIIKDYIMSIQREIIVVGGNHHNTLGVIRGLGFGGVKPIVILHGGDENDPYVAHSCFIKEIKLVSSVENVLQVLRDYSKKLVDKAIVIACSDGTSSLLDMHSEELSEYYILPGSSKQGLLTTIMNKEKMAELGRSVGFNVPKSWVVETEKDIDGIEYPCITKPILSKDGHKSDIKVCQDKNELLEVLKNGSCYRYQVQKFVEKDFEYQLIGLSLNKGQEIIIPGFSRCIRPCPGTNTGFLRYQSLDTMELPLDKCKVFIKQIGYSGLFSIEFLRDKFGTDYFLEMNFRNDGNSICVTKAGYNLPYLWYAYNIGFDYKAILNKCNFKEVLVMPELDDFNSFVRKRKISIWKWIKDVSATDAFMEFDRKDPKPFWIALKQYIGRGIRKVIK